MANPPAYQYYAADFDEDTASWNNEEVGIYQRLLNYSWVNGWTVNEGLPDDPKRLAMIVRCSYKKFQKRWEIIQKKFSRNGSGFLVNRRLEEERAKLVKYVESQRESGKRGAEKRWKQDGDPIADPISNPIDEPNGETMALPSSSSLKKEKKIYKRKVSLPKNYKLNSEHIEYAKSKGITEGFEDIFEAFCIHHRKIGSKWTDWYAAWQTWIRKKIEIDKAANRGPVLDKGIEHDNTAVEEARKNKEDYDPIKAREKIRELALGVTKGV